MSCTVLPVVIAAVYYQNFVQAMSRARLCFTFFFFSWAAKSYYYDTKTLLRSNNQQYAHYSIEVISSVEYEI